MGTMYESAEAGRSQLSVMSGICNTLQALGASHGSVVGHFRLALRGAAEIVINGMAVYLRALKISFAGRDSDKTKISLD